MSVASIHRWRDGALEALDYCDLTETVVEVADSWLVSDGMTLALDLHRDRFFGSAAGHVSRTDLTEFWDAAIAAIPAQGHWFPRVELHSRLGSSRLIFRLRSAPELRRSAVLATWNGEDPRRKPLVKGPDLERLGRVRTSVQALGADEAVLLTPEGAVIEATYSAMLWWRGGILCGPPADFDRIDSVTARSVLAVARALGHDTFEEAVTPAELEGTEIWAVNALHGIRIVTGWADGPQPAELPGRLNAWRARLDALRRPIHVVANEQHG